MYKKKVKLLVIENDDDRVDLIKEHFNEEIYSIDFENDWQNVRGKINETEYDVIILSHRLTNYKEDAVWFLNQLEVKDPKTLDTPFLIYTTAYDIKIIERTLKVKKFRLIDKDKDSKDFLSEMEWAVINLFPKAFYLYRVRINDFEKKIKNIKDNENMINDLENKQATIVRNLRAEQKKMQETYISWRSITETLGILVGAFSFTIGITIAIISLLFKQSIVVNDYRIPLLPMLLVFAVVFGVSVFFSYLLFKRRAKKIVEKEISIFLPIIKKEEA